MTRAFLCLGLVLVWVQSILSINTYLSWTEPVPGAIRWMMLLSTMAAAAFLLALLASKPSGR